MNSLTSLVLGDVSEYISLGKDGGMDNRKYHSHESMCLICYCQICKSGLNEPLV